MIVIDASALLEVLLHTEAAERVAEPLLAHRHAIHAPHLIDAEVAQVVRRYVLHRMIDASQAAAAIADLAAYPIHRHAHVPLLPRVWDLHTNVSAYDALYLALAEMLDAPLLTRDRRLAVAGVGLVRAEVV